MNTTRMKIFKPAKTDSGVTCQCSTHQQTLCYKDALVECNVRIESSHALTRLAVCDPENLTRDEQRNCIDGVCAKCRDVTFTTSRVDELLQPIPENYLIPLVSYEKTDFGIAYR